jgi:hypothetical protein
LIMTNERFEREKVYEIMLCIARSMLRNGLLTEDEVRIIDDKLIEKYAPLLSSLYPSNA